MQAALLKSQLFEMQSKAVADKAQVARPACLDQRIAHQEAILGVVVGHQNRSTLRGLGHGSCVFVQ